MTHFVRNDTLQLLSIESCKKSLRDSHDALLRMHAGCECVRVGVRNDHHTGHRQSRSDPHFVHDVQELPVGGIVRVDRSGSRRGQDRFHTATSAREGRHASDDHTRERTDGHKEVFADRSEDKRVEPEAEECKEEDETCDDNDRQTPVPRLLVVDVRCRACCHARTSISSN